MSIIVTDRLGHDKADTLPGEIVELCKSIGRGSDTVLLPNPVQLKRLGVADELGGIVDKDLSTVIEGGIAGNTANGMFIDKSIATHLREIRLGENFSIHNRQGVDVGGLLERYLKDSIDVSVYYYYPGKPAKADHVYNDIAKLRTAIAREANSDGIVVVFGIPPKMDPIKPDTGTKYRSGVDTDVVSLPTDAADRLYNELSEKVRLVNNSEAMKRRLHQQLAKAQSDFPWDYRFTYERAKLAVYGRIAHDIAFDLLYLAAEIAIENADARKMKERLAVDSMEDEPFYPLARGHQEWRVLIHALTIERSELVRR